jgi:hypothetical protein
MDPLTGTPDSFYSQREEGMFDVTQKANEMIKEALKDQEKISAIRVAYNEGG